MAAEIRRRLIDDLTRVSPIERLDAIAFDAIRPVAFYSAEWACISPAELRSLSEATRGRLLTKLSGRRKGTWRTLYLAVVFDNESRSVTELRVRTPLEKGLGPRGVPRGSQLLRTRVTWPADPESHRRILASCDCSCSSAYC